MSERKKQKPRKLGDVVGDVFRNAGVADRVAQAAVIPGWRALVGPQIARVTEPLSVTPQGILFVAVTTNAWMNELSLLEPELLRSLNTRSGRIPIKRIRWLLRG